MKTNVRLILFPFLLCLLLVLIQSLIDNELDKPKYRCGCTCIDTNGDGRCEEVCGVQFSTLEQASSCPIESPPEWPPLLQMPAPEFRAVRTNFNPFLDLPDESCRRTGTCPATVLFTGTNQSLAESTFIFLSFVYAVEFIVDLIHFFMDTQIYSLCLASPGWKHVHKFIQSEFQQCFR